MAAYYIDPVGGSANAAGTSAAQPRLTHRDSNIQPGDTVLFQRGRLSEITRLFARTCENTQRVQFRIILKYFSSCGIQHRQHSGRIYMNIADFTYDQLSF